MLASGEGRQKLAIQSGARLMAITLAVGALTVIGILAGFARYQIGVEKRLYEERLENYVESVGDAISWGTGNWLRQRVLMAERLAGDLARLEQIEDPHIVLASPVFRDTFMWTYFGEVDGGISNFPVTDWGDEYDPRERPWYTEALAANGTVLTEPYSDYVTGKQVMTMATPVYRDGALLGVVGVDFSIETLNMMLDRTDLGGVGHAFLVTGDGEILGHPRGEYVSQTINEIYASDMPAMTSQIQYLDDLHTPELVAFVKVEGIPAVDWRLGISVDQAQAFAGLVEMRNTAIAATMIASILMVLILGFVIHRLLVRPLNDARLAADAANVAKSEFLASMSHEIRTPMNGVLGMAEVLAASGLDSRQKGLAEIITSSGNALMTVIDDILDVSKLEAGKLRISPASFNLRRTIFDISTMMQAPVREKDIELIVRYAPNLPQGVIGDDARVRQVLGNLIGNAVKFTEEGYVLVDVSGERQGDQVTLQIKIEDTGIGIPEEQLPRMFEKFEQADSSNTRKFGGTGLGLAISKNIVELMGGNIVAESAPNMGSSFTVSLNLPVDDSVSDPAPGEHQIFDEVRVLAVDDNAVNRRVLQELLTGWDLKATIVDGPRRAFAALEKSVAENDRYHLALFDHQMPGEDGISLARRMKQDPRFEQIPVIVLSSVIDGDAEGDFGDIVAASLQKPVRPSQLMDALVRALTSNAAGLLQSAVCEAARKPAGGESQAVAKTKLLLAEDNHVNQLVMQTFLPADQFEVLVAQNGREAVEMFRAHAPEIVLMDLSMPIMGGLEATKKIRIIEQVNMMAPTPIIATTAHVLQEDRDRCIEAGMNDFLPKPLKKTAVELTLMRWLHPDADECDAVAR